jgi:hypothetical protein
MRRIESGGLCEATGLVARPELAFMQHVNGSK